MGKYFVSLFGVIVTMTVIGCSKDNKGEQTKNPRASMLTQMSGAIDKGDSGIAVDIFERLFFQSDFEFTKLSDDQFYRLYAGLAGAYLETGDCVAAEYLLKIAERFAPEKDAGEKSIDDKYLGTSKIEEIGKTANQTIDVGIKGNAEHPDGDELFQSVNPGAIKASVDKKCKTSN